MAKLQQLGAKLKRDKNNHVAEVNFRNVEVVNDDLQWLSGLPKIRSVLLTERNIDDDGLAILGRLTTLQNLDLRDCPISNQGLAHLAGLKKLRGLKLSGKKGLTAVDDGGLAHLAELKNLKAFGCDYLWVSEEGLEHLKNCQRLEELYLAATLVGLSLIHI